MFRIHKDALRITDMQDVASFQGKHAAPAAHPPQHSLTHSVWLHLLPGVLIVLFALIVGPLVISAGLPLLLVPSLWVLCVLIPFEVGYLLYQGKKRNGRFSLRGIILYREPMPVKAYLLLIPPLIVWGVIAFLITQPTQSSLIKTLFFWMPSWFLSLFTVSNTGGHPQTVLLLAVLLYMFTNPAAAFVEELYFRGYLLPRMAYLRGWAPLLNTVLFSLQHLFSPWQNPGRILAFLPVAYTVAWKKNIVVAIITHCLLDALSASLLLVMLYR
jgi:membrane protease YdiL (CAAX protease family)